MPQRFLRPGITDSEKWNSISFEAQSLYIRLITLVDDYGRYDGRISVITGHAFPVWNELNAQCQQDADKVTALCAELCRVKLIEIYDKDSKKFVQLTNWQERARGKSKWPEPSDSKLTASCTQVDRTILPPSPSPQSSPSPSPDASKRREFEKPTIEQILLLGAKAGLPELESRKFFHHYETNGWKVGRNPMKSLNSAVAGWVIRWQEQRQPNMIPASDPAPRPISDTTRKYLESKGQL